MDYFVGRAIPVILNQKLSLFCSFSDRLFSLAKQEMHQMLAFKIRRCVLWMLTERSCFKRRCRPTRRR